MLNAKAVLNETRRLLEDPHRNSHVTWIWGGIRDDHVVVIYRWVREPALVAYHRDVVEFAELFDPVDEEILAAIMANEIEEPGKVSVNVPDEIRYAVPEDLQPGLHWER